VHERGFINICYEALDQHLSGPMKDAVAIRFIPMSWSPKNTSVTDMTYQELARNSCQFFHVLKSLGLHKGDIVFSLSPRIPELFMVAFGTLRGGMIFSPLFSAFGPEPIESRINRGKGKVLFSLASLYRKKVLPIRDSLESLKHVILIDDDGSLNQLSGVIDFNDLMKKADCSYFIEKTNPTDSALLHFTSGTTGEPKGAIHIHKAVVFHKYSGQYALDLRAKDLFWCTADPGWVTGTSYGMISPLCNGATLLVDGAEFSAQRWYEILNYFPVNIWYTAPTAMRMLMKAGEELARSFNFSHIRFAASVGEPLNPEVIKWAKDNLGLILHDNWWQTETGGIMICNGPGLSLRPGSMGKPIPGIEVVIIKEQLNGELIYSQIGEKGEMAIKANWPSMFTSYLDNPQRYRKCFTDHWYLSGDLSYKDHDGYFWFVGRKDDVIKTSGHLIGPFEIENVLMSFEGVLESAAIGIPDPVIGELIKAFVVLKKGFSATSEIKSKILSYARTKLGAALAPREIDFIDNLPKTKSGKIMRRLLKARELGLSEGDLSTLEGTLDRS
jgi:acetyl-CoA synthetase